MYWQVPFYVLPHIIAMLMQAVIPVTSILPNMVVKPRYKEGVLSAKKLREIANFVNSRL